MSISCSLSAAKKTWPLNRKLALLAGSSPNPQPDRGQLSSLLAALDVLENEQEVQAMMVLPVDVPLISADVMRTVIAAARATTAPIVRAVHHGAHGHPVIFKRELFEELRAADPAVGAKAVVRADPNPGHRR